MGPFIVYDRGHSGKDICDAAYGGKNGDKENKHVSPYESLPSSAIDRSLTRQIFYDSWDWSFDLLPVSQWRAVHYVHMQILPGKSNTNVRVDTGLTVIRVIASFSITSGFA